LNYHIHNIVYYYRAGSTFIIIYKYIQSKIREKLNRKKNLIRIKQLKKEYFEKYNLKEDKFINSIVWFWLTVFDKEKLYNKDLNALEIGAYKGNASFFLLHLFKKMHLTAVDTWQGSNEQRGINFEDIEKEFDKTLTVFKKRLTKFKGKSVEFFVNNKNNIQYDLIYIDALHRSDAVLIDGMFAWLKTKIGGIIIFDDYNWNFYKKNIRDNPIYGINAFLFLKKNKYKILSVHSQLIIKKILE